MSLKIFETGPVNVLLQLHPYQKEALKAQAKKEASQVNTIIRKAIEEYLSNQNCKVSQ